MNNKYPIVISDKFKYAWFPMTKVASCSITRALNTINDFDSKLKRNEIWNSLEYNQEKLKNYFKFVFVRNPFDRLVSCYFNKILMTKNWDGTKRTPENDIHKKMIQDNISFTDFVRKITTLHWKTDAHWDLQSDRLPNINEFDFVGRYENLQKDFDYVCKQIKLKQYNLPSILKTNHKHYSYYYTNETIKIVEEKYKKDLDLFNYMYKKV
jgi:chondroitin 4-sulfotransferase 11